jgi:asparagine synthase (glutamine-hydrolysing)
MCGIVAQYGCIEPERGRRMLSRLAHRGPDDEGCVQVDGSWLGHRRLSIVDLETGRQPLQAPGTDSYLVGNGEIYNHEQVRRSLADAAFATRSDNEAALQAALRWGPAGLRALNGMYAFVLAGADGTFLAARDPVGIKPLYWAETGRGVTFASELKAFDAPQRGHVRVFPPGHYWTPRDGLERFAWPTDLPEAPTDPPQRARPDTSRRSELVAAVREALVRSVEAQMMGDVPVGVFLSGGLDSSLVAAIASRWSRERGKTLHTFAVGSQGAPDLAAARRVATYLGSCHHEQTYSPEQALEALPAVVRTIEHFDPELVRSAVPNYLLAKLAAAHVKVVLTGEGADELFAGYDYLSGIADDDELHAELTRTVAALHNLNLQRCDRVTMAHGLEARVPFLDPEMISLALAIPASHKVHRPGRLEKELLRDAFTGWLPDEILWRKKVQFGEGSGATALFRARLGAAVPAEDLQNLGLRTDEEVAYYEIWADRFEGIDPNTVLSRSVTA